MKNFDEVHNGKNKSMKCVTSVFTIFFEDPFWIGVLEENYNGINYMGANISLARNHLIQNYYCFIFMKLKKLIR